MTKRVSRWQRVYSLATCVTCTEMPAQNAGTIVKPLLPNPPLNPFYTWCKMLLTELHHSPVDSIPFFLPSNSSIPHFTLPPPLLAYLTCTRVRDTIHIKEFTKYRVIPIQRHSDPPPQKWLNWVFGPKRCAMF